MSHRSLVHHRSWIRLFLQILGFSGALVLSGLLPVSQAQIVSNIAQDATLGTRVTFDGLSTYTIDQGTIKGSNLFHSLDTLTVGSFDTASFQGPNGIANILARVTGVDTLNAFPGSTIDGTLQSTIPGANLFLMNPRGIVFGPNAVLDIGASVGQAGSFYATTADYIRLADTVQFNAIPDAVQDALLSSEPVVAFGFLGPTFGELRVEGSFLQVPYATDPVTGETVGQTFGLIGGDITVTSGFVNVPSGAVKLASLTSPGEVIISDPISPLEIQTTGSQGQIALSGFANLDVTDFSFTGDGRGGTVVIRSGQLMIDSSFLTSITLGDVDGIANGIDIKADSINLTGGSIIEAGSFGFLGSGEGAGGSVILEATDTISLFSQDTFAPTSILSSSASFSPGGKAGQIFIKAPTVTLDGGLIESRVLGNAPAESVIVEAGTLSLINGGRIHSQTSSPTHQAGNITVTVDDAFLISGVDAEGINRSGIRSFGNVEGGFSRNGDITVTANSGTIENGGRILGDALSGGAQGGSINVTVEETLTLSGRDPGGAPSAILNISSAGDQSGDINIHAGTLNLMEGALIQSVSTAGGQGGNVRVNTPSLSIDNSSIRASTEGQGNAGNIILGDENLGTLSLLNGGLIDTGTTSSGNAGSIMITTTANSVSLSSGGRISSSTSSTGNAGTITLNSPSVTMNDGVITTSTSSSGNAGDITANVGTLSLAGGSSISSSSTGAATGAAGSVTIQGLASPADSVTLTNSSLLTSAANTGQGGSITVDATTLTLNDATISASVKDFDVADPTDGADMGLGNIALTSSTLDMTGGTITAETAGSRNAGNIAIFTTGNTVSLDGGSSITSSTTSSGNAGQIFIVTPALSLDNAAIATSTSSGGDAGSITAITGTLTLTNLAQIDSSSTGTVPGASGDAGQIVLLAGGSLQSNNSTVTTFVQQGPGATGTPSDITVVADSFSLNNASTLSAATAGPTNAGTISITTTGNTVSLAGGSAITSSTTGAGNAGQVVITTPSLTLNNGTISTSTSGTGAAGSIIITTTGNTATLSNGSRIASSSTGTMANAGDAGSITITDSGDFSSNGSTVATSAENAKGGDISISAQDVQLSNGTSITASSDAPFSADGAGDAGTIKITSTSTFVMQNSSVTTEASQASGGRITITAPEMIRLTNSQISTSVAGDVSDTTGGDISIDPNFVILQNSQILAQAFAGTGGDITITAGVFLADPSSLVDASSQLGISGSVDIRSPVSNVAGIVARLPESVLAAQELLRAACAARLAQAQASSFVEHGRDSIPVGPDGLLSSPFLPPSPEPQQSGVSFFQPGSAGGAISIQTSGAHVRRLLGMDPTPRVQLLSGEAACGS